MIVTRSMVCWCEYVLEKCVRGLHFSVRIKYGIHIYFGYNKSLYIRIYTLNCNAICRPELIE